MLVIKDDKGKLVGFHITADESEEGYLRARNQARLKRKARFDTFSDLIQRLPSCVTGEGIPIPEFQLDREGALEVFYAPFDHVNRHARLILVGITPGPTQIRKAFGTARIRMAEALSRTEVLRQAKLAASFAGVMRSNLVRMLDEIGLQRHLHIDSCASLFGSDCRLLHPTSAVRYPVFVNREPYRGQALTEKPLLLDYVSVFLARELKVAPGALVIPLGKSAASALKFLVSEEGLDEKRCLWDFPHPSGANGHRIKQFEEAKATLVSSAGAWFCDNPCPRPDRSL